MPASRASDFRIRRGGFTIVELMVSITILTLLVAVLAGVFHQVSTTWRVGEGNIERRRGARALTDYIGAELQGAMLPAERGAVVPGQNNLQFLINPPSTQVPDDCRNADAIFWQAPLATEATFGEIAEIGYFVRWVPPGIAARRRGVTASRPALCRFFVNPSEVVADPGSGKPAIGRNKDFLIYEGSSPSDWLSPALLKKIAPAEAPSYAGLFAENVLGLWVRAYGLGTDAKDKTKPQELPRTFHSLPAAGDDKAPEKDKAGYVYARPYTDLTGKSATREERYYLPARVQISIVQIDSHHATRLDAVGAKVQAIAKRTSIRDAAEFLDQLRKDAIGDARLAALLPGVRSYTTEVQLQNAR